VVGLGAAWTFRRSELTRRPGGGWPKGQITENQQGFFKAKEAKAAGFPENTYPYHV